MAAVEPTLPVPRPRTALHVFLLVLLPALVFSNTLANGYHLDDEYRIVDNVELERVWPPWRHFLDPATSTWLPQLVQYRPLLPLTLSLDVAVADALGVERLAVHHVGNLVLHVLAAVLTYLFFRELLARGSAASRACAGRSAFAAALLFALHPVAGIPVNYLCARDLLLMEAFLAGALLAYLRLRRLGDSVRRWALVLLLLTLSILGKTNAAVAPLVLLAFELVLGSGPRAALTWLRPLLAAAVPAGFVAWTAWLGFSDLEQLEPEDADWLTYSLTQLRLHLFHYARNALWPFRLRPLPAVTPAESVLEPGVWLGLAFVLASLVVAWRLRRRVPVVSFAILAYWALNALTNSVLPLRSLATDYRQHESLPFLCLLVALAIGRLRSARAASVVTAALALYLGVASFALNHVWKDERSLWSHSVRFGGTALAHVNYGKSLAIDEPALAEAQYREALRLQPNHVFALMNLGILLVEVGRHDEGLQHLEATVVLRPADAQTRHWHAEGLTRVGRLAEAAEERALAADFDPRNPAYQYGAAQALQKVGAEARSLRYLERLHTLVPSRANSLFLEGWAHQHSGDEKGAIPLYERFLVEQPDDVQALFNLGCALLRTNAPARAVERFGRVLELAPTRLETHSWLAHCYAALGDEQAAAEQRKLYESRR